ncbi:MAG: ATP-binding protein [Planctomycetota bacterium]
MAEPRPDDPVAPPAEPRPAFERASTSVGRTRPREGVAIAAAVGAIAVATGLGWIAEHADLKESVPLIYVVAIVLIASRAGWRVALLGALLAVLANAYFFVPPAFAFPTKPRDLLMALAFLVVALVVGTMTARLHVYALVADRRARHAEALRGAARALARVEREDEVLRVAASRTAAALDGEAHVVVLAADGTVGDGVGPAGAVALPPGEAAAVVEAVGRGAAVHWEEPDTDAAVVASPLAGKGRGFGALVVRRARSQGWNEEGLALVEGMARVVADAYERVRLAGVAQRAELESRTERLRSALLSSVSHDLRTPLAVILGAATHLADRGDDLPLARRTSLAREIEREVDRLNRLVANLLSMTRLDAGAIRPSKEWQPLDDIVGAVAGRSERLLAGRPLVVDVPADLPLVPIDAVLVEQVLINLLDNVAKHTPPGTEVVVRARAPAATEVVVEVLDRGPGLASGEVEAVFERFRRGADSAPGQGVGLGLAVCRGIVHAHGGTLTAANRPDGGAAFRFTLPLDGPPPPDPRRDLADLDEGDAVEGSGT